MHPSCGNSGAAPVHCAELIYECYAIVCDVKNVENLADRQQIKINDDGYNLSTLLISRICIAQ